MKPLVPSSFFSQRRFSLKYYSWIFFRKFFRDFLSNILSRIFFRIFLSNILSRIFFEYSFVNFLKAIFFRGLFVKYTFANFPLKENKFLALEKSDLMIGLWIYNSVVGKEIFRGYESLFPSRELEPCDLSLFMLDSLWNINFSTVGFENVVLIHSTKGFCALARYSHISIMAHKEKSIHKYVIL